MTYLWCQTTHQGNQLPWELRYSIKPVWIRLWEQQTPFKSFHISRQRRPWTSRHFDGIRRIDVKKTTNARSRDSSFHQSPKTRSEVNGPDNDYVTIWRGNMTPRRERCVGKITSPLGTISSTYIHVYIQLCMDLFRHGITSCRVRQFGYRRYSQTVRPDIFKCIKLP